MENSMSELPTHGYMCSINLSGCYPMRNQDSTDVMHNFRYRCATASQYCTGHPEILPAHGVQRAAGRLS